MKLKRAKLLPGQRNASAANGMDPNTPAHTSVSGNYDERIPAEYETMLPERKDRNRPAHESEDPEPPEVDLLIAQVDTATLELLRVARSWFHDDVPLRQIRAMLSLIPTTSIEAAHHRAMLQTTQRRSEQLWETIGRDIHEYCKRRDQDFGERLSRLEIKDKMKHFCKMRAVAKRKTSLRERPAADEGLTAALAAAIHHLESDPAKL